MSVREFPLGMRKPTDDRSLLRPGATDVLQVRDWLKVFGVYARTVTAKVIEFQTSRYRTLESLVEAAMCAISGVPPGAKPSLPNPTSRFFVHAIRALVVMVWQEPSVLAANVPLADVGIGRNRRGAATSALTQPTGVQQLTCCPQLCPGRSLVADKAEAQLSALLSATAGARVRLSGHFWNLLHRFWGAVPQAAATALGLSLCVILP